MIQTIDQQLAAKAYQQVCRRVKEKDEKEYKSFAKQFPTLIHTCGLCQAVVFAQSKNKTNEKKPNERKPSEKVLEDFVQILEPGNTAEHFVESTRKKNMMEYTVLSRQAMRAAEWLKRQADALIEGD